MILFIAPYDGSPPENSPFIAAAKKIRIILNILKSIDEHLILLNSFPRNKSITKNKFDSINIGGEISITRYTPELKQVNWVGRMVNLYQISIIVEDIVKRYGIPDYIWIYNGYAFECRVAEFCKKSFNSKIILEFEDWHFARKRGFNPKPFIDWFFWRKASKYIDFGFCVNNFLAQKLSAKGIKTFLLPGILNNKYFKELNLRTPFTNNEMITVGYFGGLFKEKGAQFILDLIDHNNLIPVRFIICGTGDYEDKFREKAIRNPRKITFLTRLSEAELINQYKEVDIILNPHVINNGIFPFKIIEALFFKKLVISSKLELEGLDCLVGAIEFKKLDIKEFSKAINESRSIYEKRMQHLENVSNSVYKKFNSNSLHDKIKKILMQE